MGEVRFTGLQEYFLNRVKNHWERRFWQGRTYEYLLIHQIVAPDAWPSTPFLSDPLLSVIAHVWDWETVECTTPSKVQLKGWYEKSQEKGHG